MKILFAGIIARYPFGGVTWCSLMYLLGLRALGHEVFYIEDTGECIYDPVQNTRADRSELRHLATSTTRSSRSGSAIAGPSSTTTAAITAQRATTSARFCADADLFINLSGGSWFWRDEYARIPRRVFIDSDPVFTQLAIAKAEAVVRRLLQAASITCSRSAPTSARRRRRCRPAASRGTRPGSRSRSTTGARTRRPRDRFTTVMTWQIESFTDVDGNKDQEFVKFIDLPSRTPQRFELAINGPQTLLREHGWDTVDAMGVSRTLCGLPRLHPGLEGRVRRGQAHLRGHRSGWFSDRTECYLAAGRPALVQDTGWTRAPADGRGAAGVLDASTRRSTASIASTATTTAHAAARRRDRRASTSTPARVLPRLLETACS